MTPKARAMADLLDAVARLDWKVGVHDADGIVAGEEGFVSEVMGALCTDKMGNRGADQPVDTVPARGSGGSGAPEDAPTDAPDAPAAGAGNCEEVSGSGYPAGLAGGPSVLAEPIIIEGREDAP